MERTTIDSMVMERDTIGSFLFKREREMVRRGRAFHMYPMEALGERWWGCRIVFFPAHQRTSWSMWGNSDRSVSIRRHVYLGQRCFRKIHAQFLRSRWMRLLLPLLVNSSSLHERIKYFVQSSIYIYYRKVVLFKVGMGGSFADSQKSKLQGSSNVFVGGNQIIYLLHKSPFFQCIHPCDFEAGGFHAYANWFLDFSDQSKKNCCMQKL